MNKAEISSTRLEAFSDGVIAIIITIMVLELKVPSDDTWAALADQWHVFVSYALSFLLVAEYWLSHHMLFHLVKKVDNRILWSNLILLFFLSLIPFFTAFVGENHISGFSVAAYSVSSRVCALCFMNLVVSIFRHAEQTQEMHCLRRSSILKCVVAVAVYALAAVVAIAQPYLALALNFLVGAMYFLPESWTRREKSCVSQSQH